MSGLRDGVAAFLLGDHDDAGLSSFLIGFLGGCSLFCFDMIIYEYGDTNCRFDVENMGKRLGQREVGRGAFQFFPILNGIHRRRPGV